MWFGYNSQIFFCHFFRTDMYSFSTFNGPFHTRFFPTSAGKLVKISEKLTLKVPIATSRLLFSSAEMF